MHNRWGDTTYRRALLLLASTGLFGCSLFVVDNPQACTDRSQACPAGQRCSPVTGRCQDDTQDNLALDLMSAPDLATADLASGLADQASPDQASPDMAAPRCRDGNATSVGKNGNDVVGCPGTFNNLSEARLLCGPPYSLCTDGINVSAPTCNMRLNGFFMLAVDLSYKYDKATGAISVPFGCGSTAGPILGLVGCGNVSTPLLPSPGCQSLNRQIACGGTFDAPGLPGWSCAGADISNVSNSNPGHGVLCCR